MEEQLKLLEELQQLDLKLQETQEALASLPKKLKSMQEDVARVEAMLDRERQSLHDAQAYKAGLDTELRSEQDMLHKTKGKLAQVKTSKEYLAVQREFEANRRMTGEREDEVGKLDAAIQQFESSISVHEEELATLKQHVAQEESDTQGRMVELKGAEEQQLVGRNKLAERVRKDVLRKYENICKRRAGVAVVPATKGVCSGCNMLLPPQLYNTLQRMNSIEQCPTCQRIVFFVAQAEE